MLQMRRKWGGVGLKIASAAGGYLLPHSCASAMTFRSEQAPPLQARQSPYIFVDICERMSYNGNRTTNRRRRLLPPTREVMLMEYVTYENLYEFVMILVAIVTLCYTIFKHKK